MHQLIIMQGLPGSGKSTWAKNHYPTAAVCSADDFFVVGGEYKFDPTKIGEAHKACFCRFLELVEGYPIIVVDNTNPTLWELSPYIRVGEAKGYEVTVVRVKTDPETCASRNVHGVPRQVILGMAKRIEKPLPFWNCTFQEV
jgi:predicted kinase